MFEQSSLLNALSGIPSWGLLMLFIWSLGVKALSLWKSARGDQRYWFGALFFINTLGILELIYLLFFEKSRIKSKKK